jgi:hypothetical protein
MSLYREPGQARRRRRLVAGAVVGAAVLIALLAFLIVRSDSGPPSRADRAAAVRSAASQSLDGLELLQIEYGQAVKGGRVIAPTEYGAAKADVQRARQALADHRADLDAVDPGVLARATAALARVEDSVRQRAAPDQVAAAVAAARAVIEPLVRAR